MSMTENRTFKLFIDR